VIYVTRGQKMNFRDRRSNHLVVWLRVTRKLRYTGLVRDLRVRDWLWLEKILTPLVHPTRGKLLYDLMWFRDYDGFLIGDLSVVSNLSMLNILRNILVVLRKGCL
jgi:hypothetical protein